MKKITANPIQPGQPTPIRSTDAAKSNSAKSRKRKEPASLGEGFFSFRYRFPPTETTALPVHWHCGFAEREGIEELRRQGALVQSPIPIDDPRMASRFWFCESLEKSFVASTPDLMRLLACGDPVQVLSGPHRSRSAAENDLERYWEGNW